MSSILLFKQKKLLGILVYLIGLQIILASLTDRDLRIIADFAQANLPGLATSIHQNFVLPLIIDPVLNIIVQVPTMLIVGAVITGILLAMMALMFIGGYLLSLVLRFFQNDK